LKKVSIAFTGVKSFIDALVVGEIELKSKWETTLKVSEIRFFLHPEVWTCELAFSECVEKYMCFKVSFS
jgi:hypothetical protein